MTYINSQLIMCQQHCPKIDCKMYIFTVFLGHGCRMKYVMSWHGMTGSPHPTRPYTLGSAKLKTEVGLPIKQNHFVPPFAAYDVMNSNMATSSPRRNFWVGVATMHYNMPITVLWSAKMASIARRLFSVFVADTEMQCTPQALFMPFKLDVCLLPDLGLWIYRG
jgi:hypothetical protein